MAARLWRCDAEWLSAIEADGDGWWKLAERQSFADQVSAVFRRETQRAAVVLESVEMSSALSEWRVQDE